MGFIDKLTNRAGAVLSKLEATLAEAKASSEAEAIRETVRDCLLRLALYAKDPAADLGWLEAAGYEALVRDLRDYGERIGAKVQWHIPLPLPEAIEIITAVAGGGGDEDLVETFTVEMATHIERLVADSGSLPFTENHILKPAEPVVSELVGALRKYAGRSVELETAAKTARGEAEAADAEYSQGEKISDELLRRGREVVGTANKQLDVLSGKEVLAVVQARMDLQARYNDVLATKLEEALQRIARLEQALFGAEDVKD